MLGALPLGAALAGAGLAASGRRLAIAATAAACVLGLVAIAGVAADRRLQREDWRGAARALGAAPRQRAVLVSPAAGAAVLAYYLPASAPVTSPPASAGELDVVLMAPHDPGARPTAPAIAAATAAAGGPPVAVVRRATFSILRFGAAPGQSAQLADAIAAGLRSDAALLALPAVKLTPSSRSR